jgi:hypothetical protein
MRRAVENSQQSHYGRKDLQRLFQLQQAAAGELLDDLPTVAMWGALAVERNSLLHFFDLVDAADDVPALFDQLRANKELVSRKKPRAVTRSDYEPLALNSLPAWIKLSRGRLEMDFADCQQFSEGIILLVRTCLDDAGVLEFCRRYEPEHAKTADVDLVWLRDRLRDLDAEARALGFADNNAYIEDWLAKRKAKAVA